jgi:ABC-type sugar transport system permease subunit
VAWTRFALILINVYLSYPYFYVLASGALKSIPGDLFEAAAIDGASPFTVMRKIILPMVMRILAPLVIASFCFNFNNFTLVWGFNAGLPAMADTAVPMGYTDLLISFIYRLGFSSSNAADYGFSAAITVMLFIVVALMVFFQALNTKAIKETK